ncbi:MAG: nuclear transport factor 2 family protein [Phycisphaerae bacterium]|nr:nuclear transport factor 2 family protein [Phycisphaerae bacterium]
MLRAIAATLMATGLIVITLGAGKPTDNSEQEIRGIIDAYMASVAYPTAKPLDVKLLAEDIEALWSNGQVLHGREEVAKAMAEAVEATQASFERLGAKAVNVKMRIRGDMAWATCQLSVHGTLNRDGGEFESVVRTTFVFERRDGHWLMVHEHSSRVKEEK